jgi:hypothetical protein
VISPTSASAAGHSNLPAAFARSDLSESANMAERLNVRDVHCQQDFVATWYTTELVAETF